VKEKDAVVATNERVLVVYVEKPDQRYGPALSGSIIAEGFLDDLQPRLDRIRASFAGRLAAGEISPIGYHMGLLSISEADMAARMRISRRRVRKHARPDGFALLDEPLRSRYAALLGLSVEELLATPASSAPVDSPAEPQEPA
jgi:hypothetical protein